MAWPRVKCLVAGVAASAGLLVGCGRENGGPAPATPGGALRVVVTVPPLVGIARAIAPEGSIVTGLMVPGKSEHGYEFTPEDIARLAKADVVVFVGLDLEPKIEAFLKDNPSPSREVVEFASAAGIAHAPHDEHAHSSGGAAHGEPGHVHGPDCDHGPIDQHLWLDPTLVERLIPAVRSAVEASLRRRGELTPAVLSEIAGRAEALTTRVKALDAEMGATLGTIKGQAIVTHHNAWSRLADRYGLRVAAVIRAIEGGEPTPDAIARTVDAIHAEKVRGVFFEPQFSSGVAQRIAESAGVRQGTLDPLGDGDWFALMRANAKSLVETLAP